MNLNQVTIPSTDLSVSVPFYERLGLKLIVEAMPRYVRFELPEGDATLSIHLVDKKPKGHGVVIHFETTALDEKVEMLTKRGISFDLMPTDQSWLWREARLKDPDGNQLTIFHAGENRKNPPWRIN